MHVFRQYDEPFKKDCLSEYSDGQFDFVFDNMTRKVLNIPRRITISRRTRKGRIALAVWMGIKFAFGNSTKYGISKKEIKKFFHCGERMAKTIWQILWDEPELFYVNTRKNCVFAKSCKSKEKQVGFTKNGRTMFYRGDYVMTLQVPDCYFCGETESLKNLIELIDYLLIAEEYDVHAKNKSPRGGTGCLGICGTCCKAQASAAELVGLNRTTYYRRVENMIKMGYVTKTKGHRERCASDTPNAIMSTNKRTGEPYWIKSAPVYLILTDNCPFLFRHIIWNCRKRKHSECDSASQWEDYHSGRMTEKERVEFYNKHCHD